jgi:hypothetical protein
MNSLPFNVTRIRQKLMTIYDRLSECCAYRPASCSGSFCQCYPSCIGSLSGLLSIRKAWQGIFYCDTAAKLISGSKVQDCRSQWPSDLRRGSAATRLLRLWVRIPTGVWMSVMFVLSGRGPCD